MLDEGLVAEYVLLDGWLPGNVPSAAMGRCRWQKQFCCRDSDLIVRHIRTLVDAHAKLARKLMEGFNRISTWIPRRMKSKQACSCFVLIVIFSISRI